MGIFNHAIDRYNEQKQAGELGRFTTRLQSMKGPEIGLVFAMATHWRNSLSLERELMDPFYYVSANPQVCFEFKRMVRRLRLQGKNPEALGLSVWLHTLRAAENEALYAAARAMWRELERGFSHARESAVSYRRSSGMKLEAHYSVLYPLGFSPQPPAPGEASEMQTAFDPWSKASRPHG